MPATPDRARRIFCAWAISALAAALAAGQVSELPDALGPDRALLHFRPSASASVGVELVATSAAGEERSAVLDLGPPGALGESIDDHVRRLRQSRGGDARDARRWHRTLGLDEALAALPPTVSRLVIVIDDGAPGALRRLPFAGLLDAAGEPLAAGYSLTWAPSVEAWLSPSADGPRRGAVAIFVPESDRGPVAVAIRRRFAGQIFAGADASPDALRGLDLRRFAALHLPATFPGFGDPDGPGRPDLDLGGALAVLTAGDVAPPVDPLAASRGAFRAGARSTVVERWPVPPTAAETLYADLYGGLASGLDIATATRRARDRSQRRGEPAAVWASLAVVGRGDAVFEPLLPPLQRWVLRILSGLVVAAMVTAGLAFLWTRLQGPVRLERPRRRRRVSGWPGKSS
ncbi:MAG: CHAT domain-containing protein [Acidobacteriota bacterium]